MSATRSLPDDMSHTLVVPSPLPEASAWPSGEKATTTEVIQSVRPLRVRSSRPLATSQSFKPSPPETSVCPSGEKATDLTKNVCPLRVRSSRPLATSQSLMVVSQLPEASTFPSGEKAMALTVKVCPLRMRSS